MEILHKETDILIRSIVTELERNPQNLGLRFYAMHPTFKKSTTDQCRSVESYVFDGKVQSKIGCRC